MDGRSHLRRPGVAGYAPRTFLGWTGGPSQTFPSVSTVIYEHCSVLVFMFSVTGDLIGHTSPHLDNIMPAYFHSSAFPDCSRLRLICSLHPVMIVVYRRKAYVSAATVALFKKTNAPPRRTEGSSSECHPTLAQGHPVSGAAGQKMQTKETDRVDTNVGIQSEMGPDV